MNMNIKAPSKSGARLEKWGQKVTPLHKKWLQKVTPYIERGKKVLSESGARNRKWYQKVEPL